MDHTKEVQAHSPRLVCCGGDGDVCVVVDAIVVAGSGFDSGETPFQAVKPQAIKPHRSLVR